MSVAYDAALGTHTALAPNAVCAAQLMEAGFLQHSADVLYRLPEKPVISAEWMIRDAARLLAAHGYGLLRLYSEDEQRQQAEQAGPAGEARPVRTIGPGTVFHHHVVDDLAAGHLVIHARYSGAHGEAELLGTYPATGKAATFYTESDSSWWGVVHYPDLDAAEEGFGRPQSLPAAISPPATDARASAAHTTTRNADRLHLDLPSVPAPAAPAPAKAPRLAF
ncbi:hypothetical protein GCM10009759_17480 [Kitasatospora saccharophila]|uniref:Peptidase C39-like protein n=1 Tax=Kitasatospora saccharophila TaxID=407973 RepID=A0ABN2WGU5_9ACTN